MSAQDILVIAETKQDAVADITFELLAGARKLAAASGGQVVALVLNDAGARYADALKAADRILLIDDPALAAYSPQPFLAALVGVVREETPRAVLVGSTSIGWDLAPSLAASLSAPLAIGVQAAEIEGDAVRATCGICGGKMLADVQLEGSPAVLMVLAGAFSPSEEQGAAQVETKASPVPLASDAIAFDEWILPEAGDVDITSQEVLIAVGRGIQQEDDLEVVQELGDALGGAICASRPIVDQGWLPATRQVGKSGMTVKPKLYIALGVSGAPEHTEGMKDAELVIAVNSDADAPIFDVAHYGVVGDLMDVVPAITEALQK